MASDGAMVHGREPDSAALLDLPADLDIPGVRCVLGDAERDAYVIDS